MDEIYDPVPVFSRMADRLSHNRGQPFGGAAVIVPPAGIGIDETIELCILDSGSDASIFLSTVATKIKLLLDKIEQRQRQLQGYPR